MRCGGKRGGAQGTLEVHAAFVEPGEEIDVKRRGGQPVHGPGEDQARAHRTLGREVAVARGEGDVRELTLGGVGDDPAIPRLPCAAPVERRGQAIGKAAHLCDHAALGRGQRALHGEAVLFGHGVEPGLKPVAAVHDGVGT